MTNIRHNSAKKQYYGEGVQIKLPMFIRKKYAWAMRYWFIFPSFYLDNKPL